MSADRQVARLWWLNDLHDRENASDGYSRYGAYLASRRDQLLAWTDGACHPELECAAWCWSVATSPVMSPAYANEPRDVESTHIWADNELATLVAQVVVRTTPGSRLPAGWRSWGWADGRGGHVDITYPGSRPTAYTRVELTAAIGHDGIPPAALEFGIRSQRKNVDMAKATLRYLTTRLNDTFGPMIQHLEGG